MARLMGIDLPRNKRVEIALTYIFGIGRPRAQKICKEVKISSNLRTDALTDEQIAQMRALLKVLSKLKVIFVVRSVCRLNV
jgi:small subunit ribosomal protein S13